VPVPVFKKGSTFEANRSTLQGEYESRKMANPNHLASSRSVGSEKLDNFAGSESENEIKTRNQEHLLLIKVRKLLTIF